MPHARVTSLLLVGLLAACATACGERRARPASDSAAGKHAGSDPESRFRAQLGRTWELARLGDQHIPPSPARSTTRSPGMHPGPGSRPTIRFTSDSPGAMASDSTLLGAGGWSFCNGYGAAYAVGPGDSIRFHQFQSTLVGCDGADSLETRFFRGLAATRRFALDSATLALIAEDGSRLTFVASPNSAGRPD